MTIQPLQVHSLSSSGSQPDDPAKIRKSATDFEALLLSEILRHAHSDDDGDQESSTMLELGEQQFAQVVASSGGLGIAKMVEAGLTRHAHR